MSRRTSDAPLRDRLPEPGWRGMSLCHVRCAAERKSTRAKLRFAVRERANFAPENEYEIDGEQKKFGLDGVAVFCDGIDEIIRNGIDEEGGGEEQPPARESRQNEKKPEPDAERQQQEFPEL